MVIRGGGGAVSYERGTPVGIADPAAVTQSLYMDAASVYPSFPDTADLPKPLSYNAETTVLYCRLTVLYVPWLSYAAGIAYGT